jgi:hypothetical protein
MKVGMEMKTDVNKDEDERVEENKVMEMMDMMMKINVIMKKVLEMMG